MKPLFFLMCAAGLTLAILSVHVIRLGEGFNVIAKDRLTFRDTYVDARNMGILDYMAACDRIQDYLLYEKKLRSVLDSAEEGAGEIALELKDRLRPMEEALHEWISEKLK